MKMKGIVLACIFIVSALHQEVVARRPSIIPAESWEVIEDGVFLIQEGDELRIECQGEGRLQFSTEKLTGNFRQSASQTSNSSSSNSYTFIRPRTIKEDTGWYGCADESVEIKNDDQTTEHPGENISWIYVYVNSSNPFVAVCEGWNCPDIEVIAGGKAVVPCRPTSPELPVEFYKNRQLEPVGENIKYDPKIGFIMNYVHGSDDGAIFECKIAGNDALYPYYVLHVKGDTVNRSITQKECPERICDGWYFCNTCGDLLSDEDVQTEELRRVTTGNNLTLDCNITVAMGTDVDLHWETPNSIALQEGRLDISRPFFSKRDSHIYRRILLTIVNADKRDAGNYTCVVNAWLGTVRSSTEVGVFESPIFSGTETPLLIHRRALLVKQIYAAEAQERNVISLERVATTAQRFIKQLYKPFFG